MIRQWQRLQGWTRTEGDQADLYGRLEGDARRRRDSGEASLWSGAELALARPWLSDPEHTRRWAPRYAAGEDAQARQASVALALGFLRESAGAAKLAEREVEEKRRRELRRARRTALALGIAFLCMTVLALVATWGFIERERADKARFHAEATGQRAVHDLFDSEVTHAALFARTERYARTRALLAATREVDHQLPTGRRLARDLLAGYTDLIWGEAEFVYRGAGAQLVSVAVSPDRRWVAGSRERGRRQADHSLVLARR